MVPLVPVTLARPKSRHLGVTAISDENVGRLDVAMNDALGMGRVERVGDFDCQREQRVQFHRPPGDQILQRHALQIFHGDKRLAVFLADVVDGADVGMIQRRSRLRFALEAAERLGISSDFVGQELEGDKTAQPRVFGFVDHTHPTATQFPDNAVVRDGLSDHNL